MTQKVFVFGGTGQLGLKLIHKLSSSSEYEVLAASRNPEKAKSFPNVKWVKVDPYDRKTFVDLLKGCEVVFGALGSDSIRKDQVFTKAYPEIVRGMQESNVKRLVFVSSCYDHEGAPFFFTCCIKPLFLSEIYADIANFDMFLKTYKGPVEYTNLRPFEFTNGKRKQYKLKQSYTEESNGWTYQTNLEDLAESMIEVFKKKVYINKGVDIGNYE